MTSPELQAAARPWYSYFNRRTVAILFFGFSSGLPLYTLMTDDDVERVIAAVRAALGH